MDRIGYYANRILHRIGSAATRALEVIAICVAGMVVAILIAIDWVFGD